jgi:hypothetical protein
VPDLPLEAINDIAIPAGGMRLPVTQEYIRIKNISITLQDTDELTATTVRIVDKNPTSGPLVRPYDKDNNPTDALIDVTIQGY